jgi:hypothetical protein
VQAGTLSAIALDTDELVRPLGIIHRRGRDLSSTAERFIELLKREGQKIDAVETPVSTTLVRAVEGNAAKVDPLRNGGDGRSHGHSHGASSYMDSQQETDQEGNGRPSATESPRAARAASV